MHHSLASLSAVAAVLLSALPAAHAGLYTKGSPVMQVNAKNFDQLIAKSNHTSVRLDCLFVCFVLFLSFLF